MDCQRSTASKVPFALYISPCDGGHIFILYTHSTTFSSRQCILRTEIGAN